jgi:putative SOS response-associated peptidase YedK
MPVILTTPEEVDTWLDAPTPVALQLQRRLPDGALTVVARGAKPDGGPAESTAAEGLLL